MVKSQYCSLHCIVFNQFLNVVTTDMSFVIHKTLSDCCAFRLHIFYERTEILLLYILADCRHFLLQSNLILGGGAHKKTKFLY